MRLKILLPTRILIDREVTKINAEAENGAFTLLPRHVDFVMALPPSLLAYVTEDEGKEEFLAVDEGILVKRGSEVRVSARNAVRGPDLGTLRQTIEEEFMQLDEHEKKARLAVAGLETDLVRRFIELGKR
jgi:F-type H+-transporting ATPase subunit epsilon